MSWIVGAMLSNAVIATVMAVVVVVLASFLRHRPAVVHAMWLIVLLKFVTPPLVAVPFTVPYEASLRPLIASPRPAGKVLADDPIGRMTGGAPSDSLAEPDVTGIELAHAAGRLRDATNSVLGLLYFVACIGSVAWTVLAAVRIMQFAWLLRAARTFDDDLAGLARQAAERLGLRRAPVIVTVDARVSPLVWPAGRVAMIVLPRDLVAQANREQLELLLAHELAHVKRGDHLVRWLALAVLAVYWWHPVAWWAVRRLRVAEEQCCDAMVVAASPGRAHAYAKSLVDTFDFLAKRCAPPLLASGINSGGSLKRRCEMILCRQTNSGVGRIVGLLLLFVAVGVLPLAARVRADDERNPENAATQLDIEKGEQLLDEVRSLLRELRWQRVLRARANYAKSGNEEMKRREAIERATKELRNLGFDEELIEKLIEDREKADSASKVLQKILGLAGEDQAEAKGGEASNQ